jgi:hypothetical protein
VTDETVKKGKYKQAGDDEKQSVSVVNGTFGLAAA